MSAMPPIQDFSSWDGTPFFKDAPVEGRPAYVVRQGDRGDFLAYGAIDQSKQVVFRVSGTGASQQEKFLAEMQVEHATVTYGPPPFETQTTDKPPSTGGPTGIKKPRPTIPQ